MSLVAVVLPTWLSERQLPSGISLELVHEGQVVFRSGGKWLYPLFEVERFLASHHLDASTMVLHDQIAGRAAAALTLRMGFRVVKARMMSRYAQRLYEAHGVAYCYDERVDRILCCTEDLIDDSMDMEAIYRMLRQRAHLEVQ